VRARNDREWLLPLVGLILRLAKFSLVISVIGFVWLLLLEFCVGGGYLMNAALHMLAGSGASCLVIVLFQRRVRDIVELSARLVDGK